MPDRQPRPQPRAASPDKRQLLGVAFASADLAFEVGKDGAISFVVGATKQILGLEASQVVGRPWRDFVDDDDARVISLILADVKPGERRGAIRLRALTGAADRRGTGGELAVFRQPDVFGGVSCVFHRTHGDPMARAPQAGPLLDRQTFEDMTRSVMQEAAAAGLPLHLDLVETPGFEAATRGLSKAAAGEARRDLAEALRAGAYGGFAAAELATDRFALMRSADADHLLERVGQITGVAVTAASTAMSADVEPSQNLRAIRFALDRHIAAGPAAAADGFQSALKSTLSRAKAFRDAIDRGHVDLMFQPVVDLKTRRLHHFEALARFENGAEPEDTIRLAEELNLITEFDVAVFASVVETLQALETAQIAVNLSACSLSEPGLVEKLIALTASRPDLRRRLSIEITETHALRDLDAANSLIGRLQSAGHTVCLDDFGAGASSLDYLRKLQVDIVKIDGRYIRTLKDTARDRAIVQHVVNLCRALGIAVIAEMIEDEETARVVTQLGAALGQGWLFGKASPSLEWTGAPRL